MGRLSKKIIKKLIIDFKDTYISIDLSSNESTRKSYEKNKKQIQIVINQIGIEGLKPSPHINICSTEGSFDDCITGISNNNSYDESTDFDMDFYNSDECLNNYFMNTNSDFSEFDDEIFNDPK